jgi:hypothetical protein
LRPARNGRARLSICLPFLRATAVPAEQVVFEPFNDGADARDSLLPAASNRSPQVPAQNKEEGTRIKQARMFRHEQKTVANRVVTVNSGKSGSRSTALVVDPRVADNGHTPALLPHPQAPINILPSQKEPVIEPANV